MQNEMKQHQLKEPIETHVIYGTTYIGSVLILPILIMLLIGDDPQHSVGSILASSTLIISLIAGPIIYRHTLKRKWQELKGQWKRVVGMILLAFAMRMVLMFLSMMIFRITSSANQEAIEQLMDKMPLALYFVLIVIAAPVSEELFFREIILHAAQTPIKKWLLGLLSVVVFSFIHVIADPPAIVLFIPLAIPIVWIYLYFDNNVIVSILTHMFFNGLAFIFIVIQSLNPDLIDELQTQVEGAISTWFF